MSFLKLYDNTEQIIRNRLTKKARDPEIIAQIESAISRGLYELMEEIPSLEVHENWRGEFEPWRISLVTNSWDHEGASLLKVNVDLLAKNSDLAKIANSMDIDSLYFSSEEIWQNGKDLILIKFTVSAPQSIDDLATLRMLGKIRIENSSYSNSYETIYCEV